jgi:hypothetical protein
MILEDKILAYLDGSLSEAESSELLEQLSTSPEKRAVLEDHLRMRDVLALGRKPFEVPHATEQMLMAQLPAVGEYAGSYVGAGFLSSAWTAVTSWVTAHVVATAGAAVGIAMVGGILLNANVQSQDAEKPASTFSKSAVVAGSVAEQSSTSVAKNVDRTYRTYRTDRSDEMGSNSLVQQPVTNEMPSAPEEAPAQLSNASARPTPGAIPGDRIAHTLSEITNPKPDGYHPMTVGVNGLLSEVYLPSVDPGSGSVQQSTQRLVYPEVTFDYELSPSFAIGLEAGMSLIGDLVSQQSQLPTDATKAEMPGYTAKFYTTKVNASTATNWWRASLHYTIDEMSSFPIRFGAAGGLTFDGNPIIAGSIGVSRVMTSSFIFDLAGVYSAAWGTAASIVDSPPAMAGTTGTHLQSSSPKPRTSSIGLRAGIRYRL